MRALALICAFVVYFAALAAPPKKAATRKAAAPAATAEDVEAAIAEYDFAHARTLLDSYNRRADASAQVTDALRNRINMGVNMLDRVEKITIIDTLNVDADRFFEFYRLSKAAGRLADAELLNQAVKLGNRIPTYPMYVTQQGDRILWSACIETEAGDSDQPFIIYESQRLADGSWQPESIYARRADLFPDSTDGDMVTPFLMPDGMTLYFASAGPESLGGLDIFIARRDGDTFLQPSNVGMPYNSPANDYMLAIDEVTGIGWWASDRNADPDHVTIYMFHPSELRVNYPADSDNLVSMARLDDIAATQPPGFDSQAALAELKHTLDTEPDPFATETHGWQFPLPDGRMATQLSDFSSPRARTLMRQYTDALDAIAADDAHLDTLRREYGNGNRSVGSEIRSLETASEKRRSALRSLANSIITAETE